MWRAAADSGCKPTTLSGSEPSARSCLPSFVSAASSSLPNGNITPHGSHMLTGQPSSCG